MACIPVLCYPAHMFIRRTKTRGADRGQVYFSYRLSAPSAAASGYGNAPYSTSAVTSG